MKAKLKDLGTFGNGEQRPKTDGPIPVYGGNGILGWSNQSNYPAGTIVIGRVGAYCGSVFLSSTKCWVSDNAIAFCPSVQCDSEFLAYYLKLINLNSFHIGSSQPLITQGIIGTIEIDFPCLETQKSIARLLSSLDAKIENNNAICADLEGMAKLLYDYWFVQFDFPDENGKPYKSSGGKMVWNEVLKREIPEGWEVSDLSPFIDVIRGVSYAPEEVSESRKEGYVPLLKSNNLQDGRILFDDEIFVPEKNVAANQFLDNNSLFVTMSSGSTEHVGKIAPITFDMSYCYGAFCSKLAIRPDFRCYISQFFLSDFFKRKIRTLVVGTSIKNINNKHLTDNMVPIPPDPVLRRFEQVGNALFNMHGRMIQENRELASLRDFLLPMLMNGQVKVG